MQGRTAMTFRHSITIVTSPRPKVGKTLLARLLTDFHRNQGRAIAAFDVNPGDATLVQFLPEVTKVADVSDVKGEMALFDRLIVFVVGPDRTSAEAFRGLRSRLPQVTLVPLYNEALDEPQHRENYSVWAGGAMVRLPTLAPGLRRYIEKPPFSFIEQRLANARQIPLDARLELQRWLRKINLEFRELDLRILLADLQFSIRL